MFNFFVLSSKTDGCQNGGARPEGESPNKKIIRPKFMSVFIGQLEVRWE